MALDADLTEEQQIKQRALEEGGGSSNPWKNRLSGWFGGAVGAMEKTLAADSRSNTAEQPEAAAKAKAKAKAPVLNSLFSERPLPKAPSFGSV